VQYLQPEGESLLRETSNHSYLASEDVGRVVTHPDVSPKRSLAKACSWRVIGTVDTFLLSFALLTFLGPFFGMEEASHATNAKMASYIAVAEVMTKMVLYYVHERIWNRVNWGYVPDGKQVFREGARRSGVKTATWRVTASLDTMLLAWIFTGNIGTAISIGGLEVITKLFLYYLHERAWARIKWGVVTIPT
jgi:uncharacterized membrane protein